MYQEIKHITTYDTWVTNFIETLFNITEDDFYEYGLVEVCLSMDLSELTGLFLNELDNLFKLWSIERLDAVSNEEITVSLTQAKDKILGLDSSKYNSKCFAVPMFSNFYAVDYSFKRFETLDYHHAMSLLKYKIAGFGEGLMIFVEYTVDVLCDEFQQGFIEHLKLLTKKTKDERDQNNSKPTYLTVLQTYTQNF